MVRKLEKKVDGMIFALYLNGFFALVLGLFILWDERVLRILVAIFIFLVGFCFFYGAYKLWSIKNELKKFL